MRLLKKTIRERSRLCDCEDNLPGLHFVIDEDGDPLPAAAVVEIFLVSGPLASQQATGCLGGNIRN